MTDHERPLSKRGRQAAADIANKLEQQGWSPGLILCRCPMSSPFVIIFRISVPTHAFVESSWNLFFRIVLFWDPWIEERHLGNMQWCCTDAGNVRHNAGSCEWLKRSCSAISGKLLFHCSYGWTNCPALAREHPKVLKGWCHHCHVCSSLKIKPFVFWAMRGLYFIIFLWRTMKTWSTHSPLWWMVLYRFCGMNVVCRCMGHNRGWEEAASLLCGISVELKTANAALLEAPGSSWQEVILKERKMSNVSWILVLSTCSRKESISVWFMISIWKSNCLWLWRGCLLVQSFTYLWISVHFRYRFGCSNWLGGLHVNLTSSGDWDDWCFYWQAFDKAGMGGWKLVGILKPDTADMEGGVLWLSFASCFVSMRIYGIARVHSLQEELLIMSAWFQKGWPLLRVHDQGSNQPCIFAMVYSSWRCNSRIWALALASGVPIYSMTQLSSGIPEDWTIAFRQFHAA